MEQKYIYRCEDSAEGIFTAIYDAWASTHTHAENRIEVDMEENSMMTLFSEYITVIPDQEKSRKVQRSIRSRISDEAYDMVMKTVLSQEPEKGEVIYRFLIWGITYVSLGSGRHPFHAGCFRIFELSPGAGKASSTLFFFGGSSLRCGLRTGASFYGIGPSGEKSDGGGS